ncbi:MAG: hypothetical protein JWM57_3863 [Phycisphaerales bacterium]|nr:hypothetical protein [Phycisphaerales bacterium]
MTFLNAKVRAFTLVELLVVIGIIALLIAILLPVLNGARRAGMDAKCLSNVRQLSAAFTMYMNDYKGMLPVSLYAGQADQRFWTNTMAELKYAVPTDSGNSVFMCPAGVDEQFSNLFAAPASSISGESRMYIKVSSAVPGYKVQVTNYALNGDFTSQARSAADQRPWTQFFPFVFFNESAAGYIRPAAQRVNVRKNATRLALIGDGTWMFSHDAKRFSLRHGSNKGGIGDRKINIGFADGHAEPIAGDRIPNENDGSLLGTKLNNDDRRWDIDLTVLRIP